MRAGVEWSAMSARLYTLERRRGRPCFLFDRWPHRAIAEARAWVAAVDAGYERCLVEVEASDAPGGLDVKERGLGEVALLIEQHGRSLAPWIGRTVAEHDLTRAHCDGYAAGFAGRGSRSPSYAEGELVAAWERGWRIGRARNPGVETDKSGECHE